LRDQLKLELAMQALVDVDVRVLLVVDGVEKDAAGGEVLLSESRDLLKFSQPRDASLPFRPRGG
jgi:hypothetical protein